MNVSALKMQNAAANVESKTNELKKHELEKVKKAAQEFESLFLNIVLEKMRKTVQKGGLIDGGNAEDIYRSMLDQEYSKIMSQENFTGLSAMIEKQLLGNRPDLQKLGKNEALKNYGSQMRMAIAQKPKGVKL